MINTITKENLRTLREEINAALAEVGQRHGIKINAGTARFTPANATFKLDIAVKTAGTFETKERTAFKDKAVFYGLQPSDLDKYIEINFVRYQITGLLPKSRQYPILLTRVGDKRVFKFGSNAVKTALVRSENEPITA